MQLPNTTFETIDDFLLDPSFRKWVFNSDLQTVTFWNNWSKANPAKQPMLKYCFSILHNLYMQNKSISDDEVSKEIEKILSKIRSEEPAVATQKPASVISFAARWKWAAAAAFIIICASILLLIQDDKSPASYEAFVRSVKSSSSEFINKSDTIQVIHLADGSIVSLYKNSKVTYAFVDGKREVYMAGKAFFEVKKNPAQPFVVYTDKVVTKVLGTSFLIDAYPTNQNVSVIVRTGKVSVYKREDFTEKSAKPFELDGLLVTPNQQVVLQKSNAPLVKLLVENPVKLSVARDTTFRFSETPIKNVFTALKEEYGINIVYDEEVLGNCTLTAQLGTESFYDKLNIITKAIGSTYAVIDGNVLINSSTGCK